MTDFSAVMLKAALPLIGAATGLATFGGGLLAIRFRSRISDLAGFGSGAIIAIALADLLPEAMTLGRGLYAPQRLMLLALSGFLAYLAIDRLKDGLRDDAFVKRLGPGSLVLHSLIDGLAIGLAFRASAAAGMTVAAAIVAHDLLDGANTVTLSLSTDAKVSRARWWLMLDALSPLIGIGLSLAITPSARVLPQLLALFAGLFLFIGTAELLPRSRQSATPLISGAATLAGAALVVCIVLVGAP